MGALTLWARAEIRNRWRSLAILAVMTALVVGTVVVLGTGARRSGSAVDRFPADVTSLGEPRAVPAALPLVALALASIPARLASRLRPAQVLRSE